MADLFIAKKRLQQVAGGSTLQEAYCGNNFYEPIGDEVRKDVGALLAELNRLEGVERAG